MTEPTGSTPPSATPPTPPMLEPESPASVPAMPAPASGFGTPAAAGPAAGVAYADLVPRAVAIIIDVVLVGFVYALAVAFLGAIGGWGAFLIGGVVYVAMSLVYFVYMWTRRRATVGQQFLGIETVNATDGATLTQDQALRRWVFLMGPGAVAQIFGYAGGTVIGMLGWIIAVLALAYEIYLLYTVTQSPKRQGFHDVQAETVVVTRPR